MSIYEVIIWIMAGFALLGGIDWILGNRFGLGRHFREGVEAMGALALAILDKLNLRFLERKRKIK